MRWCTRFTNTVISFFSSPCSISFCHANFLLMSFICLIPDFLSATFSWCYMECKTGQKIQIQEFGVLMTALSLPLLPVHWNMEAFHILQNKIQTTFKYCKNGLFSPKFSPSFFIFFFTYVYSYFKSILNVLTDWKTLQQVTKKELNWKSILICLAQHFFYVGKCCSVFGTALFGVEVSAVPVGGN